jgi:nitrogen fixation protein NifU and related proteins
MHSERLLDHFQNPRNAGEVSAANAVAETSNPVCGDILKLWARVEEGRLIQVGFKCRGCVAAMACGSALTELIAGQSLGDARAITAAQVEGAVDGLESASKHAAVLAVEALRKLLAGFE